MKTIFEKLIERIEKRKFNLIKANYLGHKIRMDGFLLNKREWRQYQKAIPYPLLYPDRNCYYQGVMWFRGYPLKQKDD